MRNTISKSELTKHFHLPLSTVAEKFGLCVTLLKKKCRDVGIPRWPHRKLNSLDKLILKNQEKLVRDPHNQDLKKALEELFKARETIITNPSIIGSKTNANTDFRIKKIVSNIKKEKKEKKSYNKMKTRSSNKRNCRKGAESPELDDEYDSFEEDVPQSPESESFSGSEDSTGLESLCLASEMVRIEAFQTPRTSNYVIQLENVIDNKNFYAVTPVSRSYPLIPPIIDWNLKTSMTFNKLPTPKSNTNNILPMPAWFKEEYERTVKGQAYVSESL